MVITYRTIKEVDRREVDRIFAEAAQQEFLGEVVYDRKTDETVYFSDGATVVGFAIPRLENGYYRVGPIYVTKEYRGQDIAKVFLKDFYKTRKGRAYIHPNNAASRGLFKSIGFKETSKRLVVADGTRYLQYEWNPPHNTLNW